MPPETRPSPAITARAATAPIRSDGLKAMMKPTARRRTAMTAKATGPPALVSASMMRLNE